MTLQLLNMLASEGLPMCQARHHAQHAAHAAHADCMAGLLLTTWLHAGIRCHACLSNCLQANMQQTKHTAPHLMPGLLSIIWRIWGLAFIMAFIMSGRASMLCMASWNAGCCIICTSMGTTAADACCSQAKASRRSPLA